MPKFKIGETKVRRRIDLGRAPGQIYLVRLEGPEADQLGCTAPVNQTICVRVPPNVNGNCQVNVDYAKLDEHGQAFFPAHSGVPSQWVDCPRFLQVGKVIDVLSVDSGYGGPNGVKKFPGPFQVTELQLVMAANQVLPQALQEFPED